VNLRCPVFDTALELAYENTYADIAFSTRTTCTTRELSAWIYAVHAEYGQDNVVFATCPITELGFVLASVGAQMGTDD